MRGNARATVPVMKKRRRRPRLRLPRGVAQRVLGRVAAVAIRLLGRTWRVEGPAVPTHPLVGALWHAGFLVAAHLFRDGDIAIVVSRSRDGDLIDAALRPLGYAESLRGSSSRGGTTALRQGIRRLREGGRIAVLLDGPKGPARAAKPGVLHLAHAADVPLLPVAIVAKPTHRFASWDETELPFPFARVRYALGEPLRLPKELTDESVARTLRELEARIAGLEAELRTELSGEV